MLAVKPDNVLSILALEDIVSQKMEVAASTSDLSVLLYSFVCYFCLYLFARMNLPMDLRTFLVYVAD